MFEMSTNISSQEFRKRLEVIDSSSTLSSKGIDPLASKVTNIQSTSYSDAGFRETLALLDHRAITNDAKARRRLRLDLQKEVIDCNDEIISEFGNIAQHLRHVKAMIGNVNSSFEAIKHSVIAAHSHNLPILAEASSLVGQRKQVHEKQAILTAFKHHFILSDDEIATLTSSLRPVDDAFFVCLQKAKKIRQDCELLLGVEEQTLGLELMEQTSKYINIGFQKLYKWVQREFKTLNLENHRMNPPIRRALRALAERPSLFQNCLDFFAQTRERILSESFHCALTGTALDGAKTATLTPIDLTAHDPLRYIGDMLAWMHSTTVSEYVALEVLFVAEGDELARKLESGRDAEVWQLVADEGDKLVTFNATNALKELVDRDISGATRVLRQRLEQIVQSNEDVVTAYKAASLIGFYQITFEKILDSQSSLLHSIKSLELEAMRQFRALIKDQITVLQFELEHVPANLEPPAFLQASFDQLDAILGAFETSLSNSDIQKTRITAILSEAFEPFLSRCDAISQSMGSPANAIFRINCRLAALSCLKKFESARYRVSQIRGDISIDKGTIIASQYQSFRGRSGLNNLLEHLGDGDLGKVDTEALIRAGQQLDDFLPSALMDAMDRLVFLQNSRLAREITEGAVEKFCGDFELLEQAIETMDQRAGDPERHSWRLSFPRTTAEIRILLS